jgi:ABC-type amino acid transport substrate-binding protein
MLILTAIAVSALGAESAHAQPSPSAQATAPAADRPLIIGTKEAAPFAIKRSDGTWTGISIELWEGIAEELGRAHEIRELDLESLLAGVEDGTLDAGVAAITVTPEREAVMDFTHPFHVSGLGIAVSTTRNRGWVTVLEQFFSMDFLKVVAGLSVLLLVVGWLVWIFERRANPDQFGGTTAQGIGSSFWWSAVTMTTVGYGDKAPQTVGGRAVALLWMFAALVVISSFTASITASLTVGSLEGAISSPAELGTVRVGTVAGSTSVDYMVREQLPFTAQTTPIDILTSLRLGDVNAVVYDAPILQYEIRQRFAGALEVLPLTFERQLYAIALPPGSPLREPINRALLDRTLSPEWLRLVSQYLGEGR